MISVDLSPYEARALARSATLFASVCEGAGLDLTGLPDDQPVAPLHSAVMKLELALVVAHEEM